MAEALEAQAKALRLLAEDPAPPIKEDRLLTTAQAAERLQFTPEHVRRKCREGAIKGFQDGRDWRIRESALVTYERRRTR